jgi:transcriptional regulator with PAS, ATPase and Fis domain
MAKNKPQGEPYNNRALFERSVEPVFILNNRRRLRYANPAWEKLVRQSLEDAYNLHCVRDRRASPLAQALSPPAEVMAGKIGQTRRAAPPARVGPPWWEISFLPLMGSDGLLGVVGRIVVVGSSSGARSRSLPEGLVQLRQRMLSRLSFAELQCENPVSDHLIEQARFASRSMAPVVLIGEQGAGKQLLARTIHYEGVSGEKTFLSIDCEALPAAASERLLFGEGGLANAERVGTIYLRDAAALPRDLQARLLTWLNEHRNDGPRIIAGFQSNPINEVARGSFIEDFYLALSMQVIRLLPLRERLADLSRLAGSILKRLRGFADGPVPELSPAALEALHAHSWPGNIRELRTILAEAASKVKGNLIDVAELPEFIRPRRTTDIASASRTGENHRVPLAETLKSVQKRLILFALWRARGQKAGAARILDVSRSELWRRMKELGVGDDDWRSIDPVHSGENAVPPDHPV